MMARPPITLLLGLLAALWAAPPACAGPTPSPADPCRLAPFSAAQYAEEANAIVRAAHERFGDAYRTRVDSRRHVVFVCAAGARTLDSIARRLQHHHDALTALLFPEPLARNVTVLMPTAGDYPKLTGPGEHLGLFNRARRVMVSMTVSNVLLHEYVHALHFNDQELNSQQHPVWVCEGLAGLLANLPADGNEILPASDLAPLQQDVMHRRGADIEQMLRMDQTKFLRDPNHNYALSRYVMQYLYDRGLLRDFYRQLKARWTDATGQAALEAVCHKELADIAADWKRWLLAQRPPWRPAKDGAAWLGVRMAPAEDGVRVRDTLPGSPARNSGLLLAGDVIVSVAGRAVASPRELTAAVRACRPGEVVQIELLREGRRMTVGQVLGRGRQ